MVSFVKNGLLKYHCNNADKAPHHTRANWFADFFLVRQCKINNAKKTLIGLVYSFLVTFGRLIPNG